MKLGVLVLLAWLAAGVAQAGGTSYTAKPTTTCLSARHILVSTQPRAQVLPAGLPATAILQISFALLPAQALDNGNIVFERNAATTRSVAARWYRYDLAKAARVNGVDLSKIKIRLRDVFTVKGNTITVWKNQPVKPASRRIVSNCLR